jgi:hypothetical protein
MVGAADCFDKGVSGDLCTLTGADVVSILAGADALSDGESTLLWICSGVGDGATGVDASTVRCMADWLGVGVAGVCGFMTFSEASVGVRWTLSGTTAGGVELCSGTPVEGVAGTGGAVGSGTITERCTVGCAGVSAGATGTVAASVAVSGTRWTASGLAEDAGVSTARCATEGETG